MNILEQANKIVAGDRNEQYGDVKQSFKIYSKIATSLINADEFNKLEEGEIPSTVVCKVLMAVKLGRESYKHKDDNLIDLAGYAKILNDLNN